MALAKAQGQARDGKVPIRRLYPLVVLVRQIQDERFVKRPEQKSFRNYPMAQFVYDLARFGKDGWITQGRASFQSNAQHGIDPERRDCHGFLLSTVVVTAHSLVWSGFRG